MSVALDLELTPELKRAGLARYVVRIVQEARKTAGLDVSDRISLRWESDSISTQMAIQEHAAMIAKEVLATSMEQVSDDLEGMTPPGADFTVSVSKIQPTSAQ